MRRAASADDWSTVACLAALDSAESLTGEVLMAEVDGAVWAARSLTDGRSVSDPFRPAAQARELLALRAAHLAYAAESGLRGTGRRRLTWFARRARRLANHGDQAGW